MTESKPAAAHSEKAADKEPDKPWYATEVIYVGGARAFNVGDLVPATNVTTHGYEEAKVVSHEYPL